MDEIVGRALADWDPFAGEIAQFMADIESCELKMGATSDLAAKIANYDAEELHYISVADKKAAFDDVKGMGAAIQRAWFWYYQGIHDRSMIGVDTSTDPCDRGVNTAQCRASMNQRSSNNGKNGGSGRTGGDIPDGGGRGTSPSSNRSSGHGGNSPSGNHTWSPPPPPPTPADIARIPAKRPGLSRLSDGQASRTRSKRSSTSPRRPTWRLPAGRARAVSFPWTPRPNPMRPVLGKAAQAIMEVLAKRASTTRRTASLTRMVKPTSMHSVPGPPDKALYADPGTSRNGGLRR